MITLVENIEIDTGAKYNIELDSDKGEYIIRFKLANYDELINKFGKLKKWGKLKEEKSTMPPNIDLFGGEYYYANLEVAIKGLAKRLPRIFLNNKLVKDLRDLMESIEDYKSTLEEAIQTKIKKEKL